jgi:hypothetical protein
MTNRRNFLKAAGIGVAAAAVPGLANAGVSKTEGKKHKIDFKLGDRIHFAIFRRKKLWT